MEAAGHDLGQADLPRLDKVIVHGGVAKGALIQNQSRPPRSKELPQADRPKPAAPSKKKTSVYSHGKLLHQRVWQDGHSIT